MKRAFARWLSILVLCVAVLFLAGGVERADEPYAPSKDYDLQHSARICGSTWTSAKFAAR